jgi:chromosome segregation ATPase
VVPEDYAASKTRVTELETSIEQARQEAQSAQQRVEDLREELAHRERQKAYAIREGIQMHSDVCAVGEGRGERVGREVLCHR